MKKFDKPIVMAYNYWMAEIVNYPFKDPDFKVGESEDKNIWAYEEAGMVVKQDKRLISGAETTASLASVGYVLNRAELDRKTIANLREKIKELGGNEKTMEKASKTKYVVHATPEGTPFYTETQPLVRNYQHLADLGLRVFTLPRETLHDLSDIFKAVYETAKENDYTIDLAGSPPRPTNMLTKVTRHLFPITSSLNIVVDSDNQAHFIDVGRFEDANPHGNVFGLRRKIQTSGAFVGYISTKAALSVRNFICR